MPLTIEEAKKKMTKAFFMRRKKIKKRNKNSKSVMVTTDGRRIKITSKIRAARRLGAKTLARAARKGATKRKTARTKMKRRSIYGESVQHGRSFIEAVSRFVGKTNRTDIGEAILTQTDPSLTSSPIGLYALSVSEKIDEVANLSGVFSDAVVLDQNTIGFFFSAGDSVDESSIHRCLKAFGQPALLAKPGDKISESEQSDMYLYSLTVGDQALEDGINESDEDLSFTAACEAVEALMEDAFAD